MGQCRPAGQLRSYAEPRPTVSSVSAQEALHALQPNLGSASAALRLATLQLLCPGSGAPPHGSAPGLGTEELPGPPQTAAAGDSAPQQAGSQGVEPEAGDGSAGPAEPAEPARNEVLRQWLTIESQGR